MSKDLGIVSNVCIQILLSTLLFLGSDIKRLNLSFEKYAHFPGYFKHILHF